MGNKPIPPYTKDEYLNGSAPYEFLYGYKDNKFLLAQYRERMKQAAESIGVKGFIGMWNAYLETVQRKDGIITENTTMFDGQQFELLSGEYICSEYGVKLSDKYGYDVEICPHPIMPIKRIINIDTNEEQLTIAYKKGAQWREITIDKAVVASSNQIINLAKFGIVVNSENAKLLSTYLMNIEQLNYNSIPEERSVTHLGWIADGRFVPYDEDVKFDGEINYKHLFDTIKSHGSFDKWLEFARYARKYGMIARIDLAASFASVIISQCGLLPFIVHTWGGSSNGKSVGIKLAASVWADPEIGHYVATFNGTDVGKEEQAGVLCNLPLCLDELQLKSSSMKRKDFDEMVYKLCEGVGKLRGAKNGGLRKLYKWRNTIISTGEEQLANSSSMGGVINRIIDFDATDYRLCEDLIEGNSIINQNYGHAGKIFIDELEKDGVMEYVRELQKKYYDTLLKSDTTDKQAMAASVLLTADELATKWIFKDDMNLTVDDVKKLLKKKSEVDVNRRANEFIFELVGRNPNKFKPGDNGEYQGEVWGCIENNQIFIIKSVFDAQMELGGFNPGAFLAWAKRNDKIICAKNRTTKLKRIGGSTPIHCVCLVVEPELKEYTQGELPF